MFVQDILQRHSNKKADFRRKKTSPLPRNWNNREKERTLPLGSEEGFFRAASPRVKKGLFMYLCVIF